jgi:hypothetical protein
LSTRRRLLAATAAAFATVGTHAAEPAAEVDIEFLEFLGSVDAEEEEWREYLAERPIRGEMGKPAAKADERSGTQRAPAPKPAPEKEVKKP